MNRKSVLLAAAAIAAVAAISVLIPRQLLAQVRAALVRDVDNPARQPVVLEGAGFFSGGSFTDLLSICTAPATCTSSAPAGKRLVIESMSVEVTIPSGQVLKRVALADAALSFHHLSVNLLSDESGLRTYTGTHLLRMYFEPGALVRFNATKSSTIGTVTTYAHGYGYLVDLN